MSRGQSSVILCGQPQLPNGSLKSIGNGQPPSLVWAVFLTRGTVFSCHWLYSSQSIASSLLLTKTLFYDLVKYSYLLLTFYVKISNIWVRARAVWWVWPETESQHCYRDRDRQTPVRISGAITTTLLASDWSVVTILASHWPGLGSV